MQLFTLFTDLFAAAYVASASGSAGVPQNVTVENFHIAETELYLNRFVDLGAFGKFTHMRSLAPVDPTSPPQYGQPVVRMNRDTLYSLLVVDLTLPASVSIPDVGERYFSLSMLSGEHDTFKQLFAGNHTLTKDDCGCEPPCRQTNGQLWSTYKFHSASCTAFGTRYAVVLGRMYYQQGNETDLAIAHSLQDGLTIEQEGDTSLLTWEPPAWDMADLMHIRGLLKELKVGSTEPVVYGHFNGADKVDHLHGLLNVAAAWGGPHGPTDQFYVLWTPPDDRAQYIITIGDVPIIENGFWSITVYSREGYLFDEKGTYQWTREKGLPTTVILGDCEHVAIPCVTTHPGWNIALRIFRPAPSVISGDFKMPMPVLFKR